MYPSIEATRNIVNNNNNEMKVSLHLSYLDHMAVPRAAGQMNFSGCPQGQGRFGTSDRLSSPGMTLVVRK